jgi:hypothetical protein
VVVLGASFLAERMGWTCKPIFGGRGPGEQLLFPRVPMTPKPSLVLPFQCASSELPCIRISIVICFPARISALLTIPHPIFNPIGKDFSELACPPSTDYLG